MMAGYFYPPPPSQIGGSQPFAPRLGIVQSGPTPQAPPLRGPIALATLAVIASAWTPSDVRAQTAPKIAPLISVLTGGPPPIVRQPHIVASWSQDPVTVLYLTQIAANIVALDAPPVRTYVNSSIIRAAWDPPWLASQGYTRIAPNLAAPAAPSQPPVLTHVNERIIGQAWVPPWYGPPRPLSTSALPAAPVATPPPVLTRVNDRVVLQAWVPAWVAPPRLLSTSALPAPIASPPVRTHTVLHSIVAQWVSVQPQQRRTLSPPAVSADVIYETIPYLIGQFEDSARYMLGQIYMVVSVIGTGGTVQAQSVEAFTLAPRGTTVIITMGGPANNGRRTRRGRGQPPYNSGVA